MFERGCVREGEFYFKVNLIRGKNRALKGIHWNLGEKLIYFQYYFILRRSHIGHL